MIVEDSKYYICKNEILNSYFEFNKVIDYELLIAIFILINKNYPSFLINRIDFTNKFSPKKWEDVVMEKIPITSRHDLSIGLSVPLFYPLAEDFCKNCYGIIEDSMNIYYGFDGELGKSFLAINFYGNLYTNIVSYWHEGPDPKFVNIGREYIHHDISEIASKNREIMRSFLIELEFLLDGEIVEYISHYLNQKYLDKYGIKEDAVYSE